MSGIWNMNLIKKIKKIFNNNPLDCECEGLCIVEISTMCNLNCPDCFVGCNEKEDFARIGRFMELNTFKNIVDKTCSFITHYQLGHFGEPMLHPDLPLMIRYIKDKNSDIKVSIITNGNIRNVSRIKAVFHTGLDIIYVSLDGSNQENYSKYRVNGSFEDVINFIKICSEEKRFHNSKTEIIATAMYMKHLKGIEEDMIAVAKTYGCTAFQRNLFQKMTNKMRRVEKDNSVDAKKFYEKEYKNFFPICKSLFNTIIFDVEGRLMPCTFRCPQKYHSKETIFFMYDVRNTWNGIYTSLRSQFVSNPKDIDMCNQCLKDFEE